MSSPPLTHIPTYAGLCAALVLGMTCNAYLDVRHGSFGTEVLIWLGVFTYTLYVGWRQRGQVTTMGRTHQLVVLLIGAAVSVSVIIPTWGFPRAGLYILGVLQAIQNCVTVTRRNLYLGLLVSLILVLFAASHFRADWTMLFYLLPYVVAVVFTLVSDQVHRRVQAVHHQSLGMASAGGQGVAVAAATATILALGALMYALMPQQYATHLYWRYGLPIGALQLGKGMPLSGGQMGAGPGDGFAGGGSGVGGSRTHDGSGGHGSSASGAGNGLSASAQIRGAANQKGMPRWQSSAIFFLADAVGVVERVWTPIDLGLEDMLASTRQWWQANLPVLKKMLLLLSVLALVAAAGWWLYRLRPLLRLRIQLEHLLLGTWGLLPPGNRGVLRCHAAVIRLFTLHGLTRPPGATAREYARLTHKRHANLHRQMAELTQLFEQARYGATATTPAQLMRVRELYRFMFLVLQELGPLAK